MTTKQTAKNQPPSPRKNPASLRQQTFEEHLQELYRRLVIVALVFVAACVVGYALREQLQAFLLHPLNEQSLVYTSPAGGLNFVIKICLLFGFLVALPLLIYQILAFIKPAHHAISRRLLYTTLLLSSLLAFMGVAFAYYVILPASLNFLEQFATESIQSLITTDEYISFVLLYICGLAAIFQLPLVMSLAARITDVSVRSLFKASGYFILGSFIFGAIITPTPDPINQSLIAGPTILLYFLGVFVVYIQSRKRVARH